MAEKYITDENGDLIVDAKDKPIPYSAYENEPSKEMAKLARKHAKEESLEDFLKRIGVKSKV